MFNFDDRMKGFPAAREQVVSVLQSINSPHLAVPGKKAGPAQAFIVSLRVPNGYRVVVYLFLNESQDCAVYLSDQGTVEASRVDSEEADAAAFAESMGFLIDNLNWRTLAQDAQDHLLRTLPVFHKDPKAIRGPGKGPQKSPEELLGRLLAAF